MLKDLLSDDLASSSNRSNFSLGSSGEIFGSNNDWGLWESSSSGNLEVSVGNTVDEEALFGLLVEVLVLGLLGDEVPQLVDVDRLAVSSVFMLSEDSDTFLSVESWVILEHIDSLMMFSTGVTSSSWMLSVLSYSTVTHGNVASQLSGFLQMCGHAL